MRSLIGLTNNQPALVTSSRSFGSKPTRAEEGYNTSGGTPFDDKSGPWTHDIRVSDLEASIVTIGEIQYYRLLLDVNEPGGEESLISMDRLEFYTSSVGGQTTTDISFARHSALESGRRGG